MAGRTPDPLDPTPEQQKLLMARLDKLPCHWSHRVNSTTGFCDAHGRRWLDMRDSCEGNR